MTTGGDGGSAGGSASQGTGLEPNVAAALSYLGFLVTGVIFVLLERDPFVRFHAFQSIFLSVVLIVLKVAMVVILAVLSFSSILGFLVALVELFAGLILGLGVLVIWIVLMIKAYQGQRFMLPVIGPMAERYAAGQTQ